MIPDNLKKEDPFSSCRAILYFMCQNDDKGKKGDKIKRALAEDLIWKAQQLPNQEKEQILAEGLYGIAPERIRKLFGSMNDRKNDQTQLVIKPQRRDVGIITITLEELKGTFLVLGEPEVPKADDETGLYRYWDRKIERIDGSELTVVLTMVGYPRNVRCALAAEYFRDRFHVDLMVLIGFAAGPRGKVKLGDVVIANHVYDYEHVRCELDEKEKKVERPRPEMPDLTEPILQDIASYNSENGYEIMENTIKCVRNLPKQFKRRNPEVHKKTVAAGERLYADGSLKDLLDYDERIRAGDQEDSGFAQACAMRKLPWCVFRGIADFGDPWKKKKWHLAASIAAASHALAFLRTAYRPPAVTEF